MGWGGRGHGIKSGCPSGSSPGRWCAKRVLERSGGHRALGRSDWAAVDGSGLAVEAPTSACPRDAGAANEKESRTQGRSATRAWPFPRRGGGHRRRLASGKCVTPLQMDGWWRCRWMGVRQAVHGWRARCARSSERGCSERHRSPPERIRSPRQRLRTCAGVRARSRLFFPRRPLHAVGTQLRGCEGFSWCVLGRTSRTR